MIFKVEILQLYLNDLQIYFLFIDQIFKIEMYAIILLNFDFFLDFFLWMIYLVILAILLFTLPRMISNTFSPYLFLVILVTALWIYPIFDTHV